MIFDISNNIINIKKLRQIQLDLALTLPFKKNLFFSTKKKSIPIRISAFYSILTNSFTYPTITSNYLTGS